LVVVGFAFVASIAAQQPPPPQPFVTMQLKPNVYWVSGGGGNSGIIIGTNGVIVVDAKTTADGGKQLLAEVAKLTPKPVTTLIETHSDGDHVNGAASFPAGIKIIAHENDKKEQEAALAAGGRGAPPADKLPTEVVAKNKEDMTLEGVKVQLLHWAPAHTSGDLVIYLPDQKIVFTGDIIATQFPDPLIHLEKNGSSEGWIMTAKGIAALDADQFVPGHGNVQTKAQIQTIEKNTEAKRARIVALVKEGKSLDDVKDAVDAAPAAGAAPPAGGFGGGQGGGGGQAGPGGPGGPGGRGGPGGGRGPAFASFTEVVYQELTKK